MSLRARLEALSPGRWSQAAFALAGAALSLWAVALGTAPDIASKRRELEQVRSEYQTLHSRMADLQRAGRGVGKSSFRMDPMGMRMDLWDAREKADRAAAEGMQWEMSRRELEAALGRETELESTRKKFERDLKPVERRRAFAAWLAVVLAAAGALCLARTARLLNLGRLAPPVPLLAVFGGQRGADVFGRLALGSAWAWVPLLAGAVLAWLLEAGYLGQETNALIWVGAAGMAAFSGGLFVPAAVRRVFSSPEWPGAGTAAAILGRLRQARAANPADLGRPFHALWWLAWLGEGFVCRGALLWMRAGKWSESEIPGALYVCAAGLGFAAAALMGFTLRPELFALPAGERSRGRLGALRQWASGRRTSPWHITLRLALAGMCAAWLAQSATLALAPSRGKLGAEWSKDYRLLKDMRSRAARLPTVEKELEMLSEQASYIYPAERAQIEALLSRPRRPKLDARQEQVARLLARLRSVRGERDEALNMVARLRAQAVRDEGAYARLKRVDTWLDRIALAWIGAMLFAAWAAVLCLRAHGREQRPGLSRLERDFLPIALGHLGIVSFVGMVATRADKMELALFTAVGLWNMLPLAWFYFKIQARRQALAQAPAQAPAPGLGGLPNGLWIAALAGAGALCWGTAEWPETEMALWGACAASLALLMMTRRAFVSGEAAGAESAPAAGRLASLARGARRLWDSPWQVTARLALASLAVAWLGHSGRVSLAPSLRSLANEVEEAESKNERLIRMAMKRPKIEAELAGMNEVMAEASKSVDQTAYAEIQKIRRSSRARADPNLEPKKREVIAILDKVEVLRTELERAIEAGQRLPAEKIRLESASSELARKSNWSRFCSYLAAAGVLLGLAATWRCLRAYPGDMSPPPSRFERYFIPAAFGLLWIVSLLCLLAGPTGALWAAGLWLWPGVAAGKWGLGRLWASVPVSWRPAPKAARLALRRRLLLLELPLLLRYLLSALKLGMPLGETLRVYSSGAGPKWLREFLEKAAARVESGQPLSHAIDELDAEPGRIWPGFFIAMLRCGEKSGDVPGALAAALRSMDHENVVEFKLTAAIGYVAVISWLIPFIALFLLVFVVPTFERIFASFGAQLPLATQIAIDLSNFARKYFLAGLGIGAGILYLWKLYGQPTWKSLVPGLRAINARTDESRLCRTLAGLLETGCPADQALDLSAGLLSGPAGDSVRAAAARLRRGEALAHALEASGGVSAELVWACGLAEQRGDLPGTLRWMGGHLEESARWRIDRMMPLLARGANVAVGLVVAFILIAMFMPLFGMGELAINMEGR